MFLIWWYSWDFPDGTSGKESAYQCRRCKRPLFDRWVGGSPGGGNGNPLQYPCLENSMDKRSLTGSSSWCCRELDTTKHTHTHTPFRWENWSSEKQGDLFNIAKWGRAKLGLAPKILDSEFIYCFLYSIAEVFGGRNDCIPLSQFICWDVNLSKEQ